MGRDYWILWQGQFVSSLGTQAFSIAAIYWLMETTGSATMMGLLMTMVILPITILGPFAGTLADWLPRRRTLVICDVLSGFSVLGLAALFMFGDPGTYGIIALFSVSLWLSVMGIIFNPSVQSFIPDLVPKKDLQRANGINEGTQQLSQIIGNGIGGVLYATLGAPLLFLLDGLSFLFSGASEAAIRNPGTPPERKKSTDPVWRQFLSDTRDGFRYLWSDPGMRGMILGFTVVNFIAAPMMILFPFYVQDMLGRDASWYGYLMAAMGVGMIIGSGLVATLQPNGKKRALWFSGSIVPLGAVFALLALFPLPFAALGLMIVGGALLGVVNVIVVSLLQASVPEELRGRVMGVVETLATAIAPLGMLIGGAVAELSGNNIYAIFIVLGISLVIVALVFPLNRAIRNYLSFEVPEPSEEEPEFAQSD